MRAPPKPERPIARQLDVHRGRGLGARAALRCEERLYRAPGLRPRRLQAQVLELARPALAPPPHPAIRIEGQVGELERVGRQERVQEAQAADLGQDLAHQALQLRARDGERRAAPQRIAHRRLGPAAQLTAVP